MEAACEAAMEIGGGSLAARGCEEVLMDSGLGSLLEWGGSGEFCDSLGTICDSF